MNLSCDCNIHVHVVLFPLFQYLNLYQQRTGHLSSRFEKLIKLTGTHLTQFCYGMITYIQVIHKTSLKCIQVINKALSRNCLIKLILKRVYQVFKIETSYIPVFAQQNYSFIALLYMKCWNITLCFCCGQHSSVAICY